MTGICPSMREKISRTLDGEAGREESKILNAHLSVCEECQKYFEIQKTVRDKMRDVPQVSPGEIEERLRRILPEREKEKISWWLWGTSLKPAFAGVLVLIFISSILYLTGKRQMKTLNMAKNEEQIIQSLSDEERDFLIFLEENSGENGEDFLELLQEIDELEELLIEGKVKT